MYRYIISFSDLGLNAINLGITKAYIMISIRYVFEKTYLQLHCCSTTGIFIDDFGFHVSSSIHT